MNQIQGAKGTKRQRQTSLFKRNFITSFAMGFTSGVPLLVILTLVQAWLTQAGVDIKTIAIFGLVSLPYSLKFLWAPWLDFYSPPLFGNLGRRRGWLLLSQIGLFASLLMLSTSNPNHIYFVAQVSFFICLFSATQDVLVDAYRRDDLTDQEMGLGSAYYVWGYRLGMLIVSGGGLSAVEFIGWSWVFTAVALLILIGPLTLLFSPEPKVERPQTPTSLAQTLGDPLKDFFKRPAPWLILTFIFFYKFGDQLATTLTTTYYLTLGYTTGDIGKVVKIYGFVATLTGAILGGWAVSRLGLKLSLWIFGVFQMVSTLGFMVLYYLPVNTTFLAIIIGQENLAAGAGTAAFMAFMAGQTNRSFSATQYALLSSLMGLPRTILSAPAGHLIEFMGWPIFFLFSTLTAIPAFLILRSLTSRGIFSYSKFNTK